MPRSCLILAFLAVLPAIGSGPSKPLGAAWREAREFLPLFTPPRAPAGAYRIYVHPQPLEVVLPEIRRDPSLASPPGAWDVQQRQPFDAFGQSGGYNRWQLARLYGASRPRVARGPRVEDGRVAESWTLVSPYPDTRLQRLEPGTLLIVLRVR